MNSWPTLKEWIQFGGIVALEVVIVFAAVKLTTLRVRSAQWRRVLWQMALVAMFIVVIGELSGVRDLARLPGKPKAVALTQRKVVVAIKEPNMVLPPPAVDFPTIQPLVPSTPSGISPWQEHVAWPALAWLAGTILVFCRGLLAQITALAFRLICRRIDDVGLNERVERIRGVFRMRRRVSLLESARAIAPFTFGIWKPVIVLPRRFRETFTADQQEVALAHELAHVAGCDSAWRNVGDFVCGLLWWHPLAWLAKRELAHSAELAADESSLLFADGPSRLAECLVACAKQVRRPAIVSWLGMDGDGFRSALGKRVARLLQLQPNWNIARPVPWYFRFIAPPLCVVLLWMAMALAMKSSQPRHHAWQNSLLGSAFAAAAEGQSLTRVSPPSKTNAAVLPDARNKTSHATEPKSDVRKFTSKSQQEILAKLQKIRLPEWGPIDNLPLSEVIRSLSEQMRRHDPESKGVNFMLSQNPVANQAPEVDPAGLPIETAPPFDVTATTVRLGTMLKDVTCEDALNVIVTLAERPVQYSIEDFAVVFSPKSKARQPLHARFFRLDLNTLQQGLDAVNASKARTTGPRGGQLSRTNGFVSEVMPAAAVVPALQRWFKSLGLEMTEPGKSIFFNDRLGMLMVRGTIADLETIETALQFLNMSPPQLTIRVKFFEVEKDKNGSALDYFLGTLVTNEARSIPLAQQPTSRPSSGSAVSDAIPNELSTAGSRTKPAIAPPVPPPVITGILTDEQFRKMVSALEKRGITDMLSAPEVTTMSGRQAQIKVVDVRYIVTDLDYSTNISPAKTSTGGAVTAGETNSVITPIAEPFEIGPVLDVVPYVMADGMTIQMTVLPTVREFLGYDDPGDFAMEVRTGNTKSTNIVKSPMPLPRFRLRQVATTANVWDGQTLMLSAGTSRQETRTRDASGQVTVTFKDKELFYFITPRLIDPAGNPVHSEPELRKIQKAIPAQTHGTR